MNNTIKISKYLLIDSRKALLIFYSIILTMGIFLAISTMRFIDSGSQASFGGFGLATVIFLFITALNSFKINYRFMQSFNITRRKFFIAMIITLSTLSLIMSIVDVALNNVFKLLATYRGFFEQLYGNSFFINDFLWSFTLFIYVASLGWLITLLYYRCNKLMKTVISIAPVLIIILISIVENLTRISIWRGISNFLGRILGFTNGLNSYAAVVTFIVSAMICFGLSYLLIRRAPIKD